MYNESLIPHSNQFSNFILNNVKKCLKRKLKITDVFLFLFLFLFLCEFGGKFKLHNLQWIYVWSLFLIGRYLWSYSQNIHTLVKTIFHFLYPQKNQILNDQLSFAFAIDPNSVGYKRKIFEDMFSIVCYKQNHVQLICNLFMNPL